MFNQYLEMTEQNKNVMFANAVMEHLKFVIISLDTIFGGFNDPSDQRRFYDDKYAFYFFHLQNALVSCGNINNVFMNRNKSNSPAHVRAVLLREMFGVILDDYPSLFNKKFRNTSEHFDERYDLNYGEGFGDYNLLTTDTSSSLSDAIKSSSSLRTLDLVNKEYITYDGQHHRITLDLQKLRNEAYDLLWKIASNDLVSNSRLEIIPTEMIIG